jgi:hypothetical protein
MLNAFPLIFVLKPRKVCPVCLLSSFLLRTAREVSKKKM